MRRVLTAGLLAIFSPVFSAQTFTATFGFPNVTPSTGTVDPGPAPPVAGLSLHCFTANGVAPNPSASGRFSFTGWPTGAVDGTDDHNSFTGALSPFSYYELLIEPIAGHTLQLASMKFDVRRSGTGPRYYCVRTGADAFTNNLAASTGTSTALSVIPGDVFFWNFDSASTSSDRKGSAVTMGAGHASLTAPLQIRIYAWNSESAGGSFAIDNVSLSGEVTPPNPTSFGSVENEHAPPPVFVDLLNNRCEVRSFLPGLQIVDLTGKVVYRNQNVEAGTRIGLPPGALAVSWGTCAARGRFLVAR